MKKILGAGLVVLFALAGLSLYLRIQAGREAFWIEEASERKVVGELQLVTSDGSRFSLSELKGQPVVVDVWASWCGPCLKNLPQLVMLKNDYMGRLEVLGLNVDSEGWDAVERFRNQFPKINFPLVRPDPEPLIVQTLVTIDPLGPISVLPSAFLIDAQGRLAGKYVGLDQMSRLHSDIDRLLGR